MFMLAFIVYATPQEQSIWLERERGTLGPEEKPAGTGVNSLYLRPEAHTVWMEQELADLGRDLR